MTIALRIWNTFLACKTYGMPYHSGTTDGRIREPLSQVPSLPSASAIHALRACRAQATYAARRVAQDASAGRIQSRLPSPVAIARTLPTLRTIPLWVCSRIDTANTDPSATKTATCRCRIWQNAHRDNPCAFPNPTQSLKYPASIGPRSSCRSQPQDPSGSKGRDLSRLRAAHHLCRGSVIPAN